MDQGLAALRTPCFRRTPPPALPAGHRTAAARSHCDDASLDTGATVVVRTHWSSGHGKRCQAEAQTQRHVAHLRSVGAEPEITCTTPCR